MHCDKDEGSKRQLLVRTFPTHIIHNSDKFQVYGNEPNNEGIKPFRENVSKYTIKGHDRKLELRDIPCLRKR